MLKSCLMLFISLSCFLFAHSAIACDCARVSAVKANMHTFQTMLEVYYTDHGRFPSHSQVLYKAGMKGNYWKPFKNFYLKNAYLDLTEGMIDPKTQQLKGPESAFLFGLRVVSTEDIASFQTKEVVLYQYISPRAYRIYGTNRDGMLIQDRGSAFYLSND